MVQVHHRHRDLGIVFNTLISHQRATFHMFSETIFLTVLRPQSQQFMKPHGLMHCINYLDKILSHGFLIDADHR